MRKTLYFICFFSLTANVLLLGQEVLVSPDINIRNNLAYDIVGNINDRLVLVRDAGDEYFMETFDEEMSMTFSSSLLFETPKIDIYSILGLDSMFQIVYGYYDQDSIRINSRRYSAKGEMLDSLNLFSVEKKLFKRFKFVHSEDDSKTLLFSRGKKNQLEHYLIDNERNQLVSGQSHLIEGIDLTQDFRYMTLANNGTSVAYFDSENFRYSIDKHKGHLIIIYPNAPEVSYIPLDYEGNLANDFQIDYNNDNGHFILAGLYSSINQSASEGYFMLNKKLSQILPNETFQYVPFQSDMIAEVIGGKKKKVNALNDFVLRDLVQRADGGLILMLESYKEFSRRSTYRSYNKRDNGLYSDRGWIDYYNEDVIVISTHADGAEHWKKVLHKKQFSQDDDAIFSSFYIFKTPSRLRLLYNDEIAKSSTISEYLIDPIGRYERRSLLNTEYENLRLRFKDGLQLSSNSMVVPSQQSYVLNLVKITY